MAIKEIRQTLSNLLPGTRYSVRVRSVNEFGQNSDWSEALEFIATAPPENATNNLIAPTAPRLEPQLTTIEVITLYTFPTDGIVEYIIQYSPDDVNWTELARTSTPLYIFQATQGVVHYFRYAVVDVYGSVSPFSPSNSASTLKGDNIQIFQELEQSIIDELATLGDILPITETEIADDAISTPKLQANSVVAGKILAGTITSNEIAANTIKALNIEANAITANELATINMTVSKTISGSYSAGLTGWIIRGNGGAEFNNVTVRGNLIADTFSTKGPTDDRWIEVDNLNKAVLTFKRTAVSSFSFGNSSAFVSDGNTNYFLEMSTTHPSMTIGPRIIMQGQSGVGDGRRIQIATDEMNFFADRNLTATVDDHYQVTADSMLLYAENGELTIEADNSDLNLYGGNTVMLLTNGAVFTEGIAPGSNYPIIHAAETVTTDGSGNYNGEIFTDGYMVAHISMTHLGFFGEDRMLPEYFPSESALHFPYAHAAVNSINGALSLTGCPPNKNIQVHAWLFVPGY